MYKVWVDSSRYAEIQEEKDSLIGKVDILIGKTKSLIGKTKSLIGKPFSLIGKLKILIGKTENELESTIKRAETCSDDRKTEQKDRKPNPIDRSDLGNDRKTIENNRNPHFFTQYRSLNKSKGELDRKPIQFIEMIREPIKKPMNITQITHSRSIQPLQTTSNQLATSTHTINHLSQQYKRYIQLTYNQKVLYYTKVKPNGSI